MNKSIGATVQLTDITSEQNVLIGHKICPFVQRVTVVLKELDINYKKVNIDLDCKPEWLETVSPTLKVPVLFINREFSLFESTVICEYLDKSNKSLYPKNDLDCAINKSWIAYSSSILDVVAKIIYRVDTEDKLLKSLDDLYRLLKPLENKVINSPYFNGKEFSMIDAMHAPVFRYLNFFSDHLDIDLYEKFENIKKWSKPVLARSSVIESVPENYEDELMKFIGGQNSYLADKF